MRPSLAIALALAACVARPLGPTVVLHVIVPQEWSPADRAMIESVGSVWRELGLRWVVTDRVDRAPDPCPRDWPSRGVTECTIDVGIARETEVTASVDKAAISDRATGEVWIDPKWSGYSLLHLVAHEAGHIVFGSADHVSSGIMSRDGDNWTPTHEDLELACRTIQRGC